ncbi:MAG: hypothetical protein JW867_01060, partial [Candidatus Omnitrophica bacterium]|nr:hypothetical protein [Candidatus Omnitrophota bacterium]
FFAGLQLLSPDIFLRISEEVPIISQYYTFDSCRKGLILLFPFISLFFLILSYFLIKKFFLFFKKEESK